VGRGERLEVHAAAITAAMRGFLHRSGGGGATATAVDMEIIAHNAAVLFSSYRDCFIRESLTGPPQQ
jgi:hypothetical protein